MPQYNDYPLDECAKTAEKIIDRGGTIYQKFTCESCGQRLVLDQPNVFHTSGSCDQCGHVTDLTIKGCNYLVYFGGAKLTDILGVL